ncbi:hypothetical protein F2Q68_00039653 [Brassica cretica]|uniref:Glycine-rich protein n=1 Tax=Brassica cretica TaxID=69181 RepID=A0A8S9MND3_BRACR|nr:hypothetical protein F2Q68_00039653 [Brassica cretica]
MKTKTFIVWLILLAAVVVTVAKEASVEDKKDAKKVEIPTVEGKGEAAAEAVVEEEKETNYEVDNRGGGGGWKGGGGQGGGRKGGGGRGGGWKGGGGGAHRLTVPPPSRVKRRKLPL